MAHPFPGDGVDERLESYAFQMGPERARLALAMDLLTDAIILLGQNRVYTHEVSGRQRRDRDIESALQSLNHVKRLLTGSLRPQE